MVLAELAGGVADIFQELRDRRIFGAETDFRARQPDLGQTGSYGCLTRDEGRATSGTTLLAVEIREHRAFLANAIDVRCLFPLVPVVVRLDVEQAVFFARL